MTQTPKEKAVELVDNYVMLVGSDWNGLAKARKCAIIAVDEILNLECIEVIFWQQVKEEIEKL